MDLGLYFRVLWRFRFLVALGLLAAFALAALSLFSVSPSGVTYRQSEVWSASAKILVSQEGFPEGRSITEQYKFVIDGVWSCEPSCDGANRDCPKCVPNEFGTMNRFVDVA